MNIYTSSKISCKQLISHKISFLSEIFQSYFFFSQTEIELCSLQLKRDFLHLQQSLISCFMIIFSTVNPVYFLQMNECLSIHENILLTLQNQIFHDYVIEYMNLLLTVGLYSPIQQVSIAQFSRSPQPNIQLTGM